MDTLLNKFAQLIAEDLSPQELQDGEFNLKAIQKLPGFHKRTNVKRLEIATILDDCITVKADDDLLIFIKEDMSGDLYVEGVKVVEAIFCPTLDEDAISYFIEICESEKEEVPIG